MSEISPELEARARAAFREGEREQAYWEQHVKEFKQRYPDQFVAVSGGVVVTTGRDLPELVANLRDLDLEPRNTWIRFVETTPRILIL